jgi:uncharacterized protein YecE (DUF72 family)
MRGSPSLFIGTSGFYYTGWKGSFYPARMPARQYLSFYSTHFMSLEVNSTFYRLPLETTLSRWRDLTPEGFVFTVKASRFITHIKRLDDPEGTVIPFLERIRCLGSKLGPVLLQLPSRFPFNGGKLDSFCKVLSKDVHCAFEFRDPDWFRQETYDILIQHGMAFCIYDFAGTLSPDAVTTDFVYVRLHGPLKSPYRGAYTEKQLEGWAEKIRSWMKEGKKIYVFFDNTMEGDAVADAMKLSQMAGLEKNHEVLH